MPAIHHKWSEAMLIALSLAALAMLPVQAGSADQTQSSYQLKKTIHLPGTEGWDYISIDSSARRLYIGREKYLQVVDVDSGRLVAQLTDVPGAHGVALAPELHRGFTVNGDRNSATMLDLTSLKPLATVKTGEDADGYAYDPSTQRVFIMNSAGGSATAIDATKGTAVGTVVLDGQPEFAVADGGGEVFINITDKNQIVALDARTLKVLHRWPLASCEGPSGLSMDRTHRRLFSACDNETMVVVDADSGKLVAALPTGAGTDASLFDPTTGNAFASAGGCGSLTVIHEDSPDHFRVLANVPTASGARTMALDEKTHDVLLVTARHGHGATHEEVLPDSFVVLVIGRS
jgi:DNA-binding beta-propeller fold protein YncE